MLFIDKCQNTQGTFRQNAIREISLKSACVLAQIHRQAVAKPATGLARRLHRARSVAHAAQILLRGLQLFQRLDALNNDHPQALQRPRLYMRDVKALAQLADLYGDGKPPQRPLV